MKLQEIADLIGGVIIAGDASVEISGVSGIADAQAGDITFLEDARHARDLSGSEFSAVIVREPVGLDKPQVKVANPKLAFALLLSRFYPAAHPPAGISPQAFVSETARLAEGVTVSPFAYVSAGATIGRGSVIYPGVFIGENALIGESCILYPNVTIREGVVLGNRVIIHAGAAIGSD
ncbi:MAG: UDP-3-O-(3-hydroxymyristoyl)glucosamine N-acyltransferase, partial [Nitrospirales bacterium]|nr:UDP-3-O-(3-hydroxymyristoyl)glucosamine N-acyltransferase [Nitrospirales bacterium]